jgi:hypothetical protein
MATAAEAEQFCRLMMNELEAQWARAIGHQARHPLRERMRQLDWISERVRAGEDLDALLSSGTAGDDALRCMVCEDLKPRWDRAKAQTAHA